jgi:hypothetical protein
MSLDLHLLGESAIRQIQQDPASRPAFSLLIGHCLQMWPEAIGALEVHEPPEWLAEGFRVGDQQDLHLLRALAVAGETRPADSLASLTEADLLAVIEAFYAQEDQATRFPHLIHHADDSGFYVPFDLPHPLAIEGVPPGAEADEVLSVASSSALLAELDAVNAWLQCPGDVGQLGEEAFTAWAAGQRWPTVAYVWGVLRGFARESLACSGFIQLG